VRVLVLDRALALDLETGQGMDLVQVLDQDQAPEASNRLLRPA
jgi:hypothetical protein